MNLDKLVTFLNESILKPLLDDFEITDISYNGHSIFYQHNTKGRLRYDVEINESEAISLIRNLANLSERQFSYQNPVLDISFSNYRVNAVHHSIGRKNNKPCCSFSIRINHRHKKELDANFMDENVKQLLIGLVHNNYSIVIGGKTSSGKTELQKYLISNMAKNTRTIVIDNVLELDQDNDLDLDITFWQFDEQNNRINISDLIKNALRNNPDYLMVAESRGEEMVDVLNSAMTGHPIITTLHASSINNMTSRMVEMIMMNDKKFVHENVYQNIVRHLQIYVYTSIDRNEEGITRYISAIDYFDENGNRHHLYKKIKNQNHYFLLPKELGFLKLNNVFQEAYHE